MLMSRFTRATSAEVQPQYPGSCAGGGPGTRTGELSTELFEVRIHETSSCLNRCILHVD